MDKTDVSHVEIARDSHHDTYDVDQIKLFKNEEVVLIPTPSADPRGMFSLPSWCCTPNLARPSESSTMAKVVPPRARFSIQLYSCCFGLWNGSHILGCGTKLPGPGNQGE